MNKPPLRSLPLEVPAPGRPFSRAGGWLGWHPAAAALATLGMVAVPQVTVRDQSRAGGTTVAFFMAARPGVAEPSMRSAEKLLAKAASTGKNGLAATDPAHPLLAALAAVENLAALVHWNRTGGPCPLPVATGPFLRLLFPAELRPGVPAPLAWPAGAAAVAGFTDAATAAALVAVGFVPRPCTAPGGAEALAFPEHSSTFPGLTLTAARAAIADAAAVDACPPGRLTGPVTLPDFPPDEHPFLYALRGAQNVARLHACARHAAADPLRQLVSPHSSQRTALVTDHLLASGPKNERLLVELERHLTRSS